MTKEFNNLLPDDGTALYLGRIMDAKVANYYLETLLNNISWEHDKVIIYGKEIIAKREVAWYGDKNLSYTYSGIKRNTLPWTHELLEIKKYVEEYANETFNSCLLNLYHNGEEGIAWHSDDEKDLKQGGTIASFSLGAERKFVFKHKQRKEKIEIILEHGSLLLMKNKIQLHWLHCLPKTKKIKNQRINLTFRTIKQ
ncbi:MAG: alpha-ketoglutarate-dependent dioxygenase AlkB [Bacteroidetes bacterium]|nr:alpha-ketoglutarate-dependent dioxygenase AlkB [Bacteroidota bacterium]